MPGTRIFKFASFAFSLGLLLTACDGGSPSAPSGMGTLAVRLTDAPTAELSKVNVHVTGLMVKRSGSAAEKIAGDLGVIDLLSLQNTSMLLATVNVAAGDYEFIQVDLAEQGSSVVEAASGQALPITLASSSIKILNGFTVGAGQTLTLLLDFDASASLLQLGNGSWLMTPVIVLANQSNG